MAASFEQRWVARNPVIPYEQRLFAQANASTAPTSCEDSGQLLHSERSNTQRTSRPSKYSSG
jgi:hypothetical protein